MSIRKKVAVITGGLHGIGKSIADTFRGHSYNVYTLSRSSSNEDSTHIQCDVSQEESVKSAFQTISTQCNHIDALVNTAGINRDALLIKAISDDIVNQIQVNLVGSIFTSKHALRMMMPQKRGHIINIGSVVGMRGNSGQCAYSASKAGLVGFTKSLAKEVASRNIQVNLVAPGFIHSDMTSSLSDSRVKQLERLIPQSQLGHPKDVAELVLFLTQSSYITGQVIYCDGGLHLNL